MNLAELGWSDFFAKSFEPLSTRGFVPARASREHNRVYSVIAEEGVFSAEVSGRFAYDAASKKDFPAVGDWVAIQPESGGGRATIHAVLPRKSAFVRKTAGARTEEQVVAANVDIVFLVSGLDGDFSVRRIERYLTAAWDSGASPVVVLNKADLCADVEERAREVESVAFGVPILSVSAKEAQGMAALREQIGQGKTAAFLGSSGVGKSTLINGLLGVSRQEVQDVRGDDSRGRHTTTYRELVVIPGGGLVIDTPGMRELQLWSDGDGLERTFEDIEERAAECRFRDCRHESEPGCAVRRALEEGELDEGRWRSYLKLRKELDYLASRQDQSARLVEKARWRKIAMEVRRIEKNKQSRGDR